jgi:hypothetical protein
MSTLLVLGAVVAVAAAARSVWSPCGLSMLSSITPLGERARRYSYGGTAAWFVVGAVLGGATLGLGAAALAAAVGSLDLAPATALAAAAVLAALTALSDAQVGGFRLPGHRRQVNEVWLDRYRSWVYGGGFGWQIGVGLATFIVTASVYLTIALAALTGSPAAAFLLCTGFGLVRGLAVLLSRTATSAERMQAMHRRFHERSEPSRILTIAVQLAVAAWAAVATAGLAGALAVGAVAVAVTFTVAAQLRGQRARATAVSVMNAARSA